MAGALGLALGGPRSYGGKTAADSWLGDGRQDAVRADVVRALSLYRLAGMILAALLLVTEIVVRRWPAFAEAFGKIHTEDSEERQVGSARASP